MKKLTILLTVVLFTALSTMAQVAINTNGTNPDTSAMLDVKSTTKGFLTPRMTSSERNAITSPADGLIIFNTTLGCIDYYFNSTWHPVCGINSLADDEVINPITGRIWMDRNLGASQVATSSTDAAAYGDLYQWGRAAEGHESRTSVTTSTNATTAVPNAGNSWDGLFITEPNSPYDWLMPQDSTLWQGESGTNNPCPLGFRLPTEAEWEAERLSWATNNAAGAFSSVLKLTIGGDRYFSSGSLLGVGSEGYYSCSTIDAGSYVRHLRIFSSNVFMTTNARASGNSVRCIKN